MCNDCKDPLSVNAQGAPKPDEWELAKFLCEKLALEDFDEISRTKYLGDAKAILAFLSAVTSTERCDGADDLEHLDGMLDDRERG